MAHVQIFLSTVSAEFRSYRDALRRDLDRPNVTVKVQEDFIATGTETLDKLDEYIRQCDAVIHVVGDMTGALAQVPSVAVIRQRYPDLAERLPVLSSFLDPGGPALSYTQWEAWLALYHGKVLIVAAPQDGAPRDQRYQLVEDQGAGVVRPPPHAVPEARGHCVADLLRPTPRTRPAVAAAPGLAGPRAHSRIPDGGARAGARCR